MENKKEYKLLIKNGDVMKKRVQKLLVCVVCLSTMLIACSCFKKYEIKESKEITPTIEQTRDFLKVDVAVKETTTKIDTETEINTDLETNIEITEVDNDDNSQQEDIDEEFTLKSEIENETSTEDTESETEEKEEKTTKEIELDSNGNRVYTPTALNTAAPYKNPNILKDELTASVENKGWTYGKSPVSWVYVRPNTKIVSNYRPSGSIKYAINSKATSGEYGCFLPIFSGTNNVDEYYEGRFYCFDDYSKSTPDGFRWTNGLEDFKIEGIKVLDILKMKYKDLLEVKKGLVFNENAYINIVYVSDLYDILNNK